MIFGKIIKSILCLVLLASLMCGCQVAGEDTSEADTANSRENLLVWSYYETEAQQEALDKIIDGFNEVQSEYIASWEYVPMTEFSKKLAMGYTENALPDVVILDNPDMPYYIKAGLLEDISDIAKETGIQSDFYDVLLGTVYENGKLYGVPFNCNNTALFYRKDIFEEEGLSVPSDWQELSDTAKAVTKNGQYGFLMCSIEGEQGGFQVLPWILSAGEDIESLGGEKTAKAYEFLYNLIIDGSMDPNCINYSQIDVARKFINGEAVMIQNGPWIIPMLEEAGIEYAVAPLPADERASSVVGGENLTIIRGKNAEGGKDFIKYVLSDEVLESFCEESSVLAPKKTLEINYDDNMMVFADQMDKAVLRTQNKRWNAICSDVSGGLEKMLSQNMSAYDVAQILK